MSSLEIRIALRRPVVFFAFLLLLLALVAAFSGRRFAEQRERAVADELARGEAEVERVLSELAAIERGELELAHAALPTRFVGRLVARVVLPAGPALGLAVGQAEILPFVSHVGAFSIKPGLLEKHELDDPSLLAAGRFDPAFVVLYLLPLLIIAAGYDVLSSERERGTFWLACSLPLTTVRLALRKLGARAAVVAVVLVGALGCCVVALDPGSPGAWAAWGLFAVVAAAYALFWLGLVWWVSSWGRSSAANAVVLVVVWFGLLFVAPPLLERTAHLLDPAPSRLLYLEESRAVGLATAESGSALLDEFLQQHPELAVGVGGGGTYFAIRAAQEEALNPLALALEESLAKRRQTVRRLAVLAPPVVASLALQEAARTSASRHDAWVDQLRDFLDAWRLYYRGPLFRGGLLSPAELAGRPTFVFEEPPLSRVVPIVVSAIAALLVPAVLLFLFGFRRLGLGARAKPPWPPEPR